MAPRLGQDLEATINIGHEMARVKKLSAANSCQPLAQSLQPAPACTSVATGQRLREKSLSPLAPHVPARRVDSNSAAAAHSRHPPSTPHPPQSFTRRRGAGDWAGAWRIRSGASTSVKPTGGVPWAGPGVAAATYRRGTLRTSLKAMAHGEGDRGMRQGIREMTEGRRQKAEGRGQKDEWCGARDCGGGSGGVALLFLHPSHSSFVHPPYPLPHPPYLPL